MSVARGLGAAVAGLTAAATFRYRSVLQRESQLPTEVLSVFKDGNQQESKQRVLIIGAGVVGIATAYKLAKKGHTVVVLEPMPAAGEECSACAAGGMQRSNPVVNKDSWIAVLRCIAPRTAAAIFGSNSNSKTETFKFFQISWAETLTDPFFLRWMLTFTNTSLFPGERQNAKQQDMLNFTDYAVSDMIKMMENRWDGMAKISGYNSRGSLAVSYENPASHNVEEEPSPAGSKPSKPSANPTSSKMNHEPSRLLSKEEVLNVEPSLKFQAIQPTAGKYEYEAKSASSGRFAKELATRCIGDKALDVTILYETKVHGISTTPNSNTERRRISELKTNRGVIPVPPDVKTIVAVGAWTPHVLALMDLYAPVYPLKGYSMSVSAQDALQLDRKLRRDELPSRIVCDKYMFTTRLGDEVRITSIGEFSGWDTKPTAEVDINFRQEAKRQFPQLASLIDKAPTRCGHRPLVSDGILLLGAVDSHENLFVTVGPGSNGWKLALGSGEIMERLIAGQPPASIANEFGFDVNSFAPKDRILHAPFFAKLCRARWNV